MQLPQCALDQPRRRRCADVVNACLVGARPAHQRARSRECRPDGRSVHSSCDRFHTREETRNKHFGLCDQTLAHRLSFERPCANPIRAVSSLDHPWRDDALSPTCTVRVAPLKQLASAFPKARPPHPRSPCVSPPCAGAISAEQYFHVVLSLKILERIMAHAVRTLSFTILHLAQPALHLARRAFILHCCSLARALEYPPHPSFAFACVRMRARRRSITLLAADTSTSAIIGPELIFTAIDTVIATDTVIAAARSAPPLAARSAPPLAAGPGGDLEGWGKTECKGSLTRNYMSMSMSMSMSMY